MRTRFGKFCSFILILGFLTAGISPACHFVSGGLADENGMVEICAADGSIKLISLAEAGLLPEQAPRHQQSKSSDCMFCFASANLKLAKAKAVQIDALPGANYLRLSDGMFVPESLSALSFEARGPPATVV